MRSTLARILSCFVLLLATNFDSQGQAAPTVLEMSVAGNDGAVPFTVAGDWYVTHPDWKSPNTMTIRPDGTFTMLGGSSGKWTLSADGGTPMLVFRWEKWGTESVAMITPNHFRGQTRPARFIDMHRIADLAAKSPALDESLKDSKAKDASVATFVNTLGMEFVPVPIYGGPTDTRKSGVRVSFARAITTVAQYGKFAKATEREWAQPDFKQEPEHPAVMVSWEDAKAFCDWLTAQEREAGKLPAGAKYRLPTDHEWSCAVGLGLLEDANMQPDEKSGKIEVYPWGSSWPPPKGGGNYADDSTRRAGSKKETIEGYDDGYAETSPVKAFHPNALGLYDMGGNVWEWCEDWLGAGENATFRVWRGGSCGVNNGTEALSSYRHGGIVTLQFNHTGFRCVLEASTSD